MEKLYRKKANGRYEDAGYINMPDLYDGIWIVTNKVNSRSKESLVWRVGDLKRPVDVTTHAAFYSIADEIAGYIVKLHDPKSKEFVEASHNLSIPSGANGIGVYNISAMDYATLILHKIATYFEDDIDPPSLYELTRDFCNENPGFWEYRDKLEKHLRKHNFIIKKAHKKL